MYILHDHICLEAAIGYKKCRRCMVSGHFCWVKLHVMNYKIKTRALLEISQFKIFKCP